MHCDPEKSLWIHKVSTQLQPLKRQKQDAHVKTDASVGRKHQWLYITFENTQTHVSQHESEHVWAHKGPS